MFNFKDQNILVTGGTRGIGKAIVGAFLEAGANVWATYQNNQIAAQHLQNEYASYNTKLSVVACDMQQPEALSQLFARLENEGIQLHVVVNNAGIKRDGLLASLSFEDWNQVLTTNLTGSFLISKLSVLHFLRNRYGRLIHMSSLAGRLGLAGQSNYGASKAAQIMMVKSLAKEVARKNITVNAIAPGFIETEMLHDMNPEQLELYKKEIPLRRLGRAEEVAHGVLFLASKEASYITGTTLEITGGLG